MKNTLSTLDIARMLGVAVGSVANWIDQKQLKAGRTPGGHRRVQVEDLISFLHQQNFPIPPELMPTPTILIIDNEQATSGWVASEIKQQIPQCEVLQANDAFSAGELVGTAKPEIVILDVRMSEVAGFEICRRIKSQEKTKNIVVIFLVSSRSAKLEKRIVECGGKVCLTKPADPETLMKEISEALKLTHTHSPKSTGRKVG